MAEKISPVVLYILMGGMLITGTLNTVFLKLQNLQTYTPRDGGAPRKFNHAFFQTFTMFIGELL